ncbi:thiamine phosphate synthase [uncultured Campylobacter sp.]|uniref:thiamine phosphate synthase n=1 Tax=uncultured Campylobacter sp. TaxID=218934 RepID=UPI00263926A0|nr:thiamine phosphate synthase [uncultured Campylobacter sp.]
MWIKKIIAVSDLSFVKEPFLVRVEKLAKAKIDAFIFRAKELSEFEYYDLAKEVLSICEKYKIQCILHNFDKVALKLNHKYFHCPLDILTKEPRIVKYFHILGTSIHSEEEFYLAKYYKCNYVIAGHIFESSSKPDLKPKGLSFLQTLLKENSIPIYAIGGINLENIKLLKDYDINGICMKSALMQSENVKKYIKNCKELINFG